MKRLFSMELSAQNMKNIHCYYTNVSSLNDLNSGSSSQVMNITTFSDRLNENNFELEGLKNFQVSVQSEFQMVGISVLTLLCIRISCTLQIRLDGTVSYTSLIRLPFIIGRRHLPQVLNRLLRSAIL